MATTYENQPIHVDLFGKGYDPFGQNTLSFVGPSENKQVQISLAASVPAKFISGGEMSSRINMVDGFYQSKNFVSGSAGWRWSPDGSIEGNDGHFRGDITGASGSFSGSISAATGTIGGFVIGPQELYGGIIKTNVSAGQVGSDGVIMDSAGLRGYSHTYGEVFNISTDGSPPVFTEGIVQNTIMYSNSIVGGEISGAIITGGTFRTAWDGRRIEINSSGIQAINGALGLPLGDDTKKFGDNTRFFGSGVLVYINNNDFVVPFYVNQEQAVADLHLFNRSADPTGRAEVGDIAVVGNKLVICTSAGTPGTFTVVGDQTA